MVTCEHGGNRIPARYRPLFAAHMAALSTHRGFDPGALEFAHDLAKATGAFLLTSTTSRLLVELNRSVHNRKLFSEFTRALSPEEKQAILRKHYFPYHDKAEAFVRQSIAQGKRVLHLSSHSFTPELDGEIRNAGLGLLYDPQRAAEAEFCRAWKQGLHAMAPQLKVRCNYPYRGASDGLATWLRKLFPGEMYAGIEIEMCQTHVLAGKAHWKTFRRVLIDALPLTAYRAN
jgi:predicted N-formylglutamate amidohydrolase